jgi:hypothetical protein
MEDSRNPVFHKCQGRVRLLCTDLCSIVVNFILGLACFAFKCWDMLIRWRGNVRKGTSMQSFIFVSCCPGGEVWASPSRQVPYCLRDRASCMTVGHGSVPRVVLRLSVVFKGRSQACFGCFASDGGKASWDE